MAHCPWTVLLNNEPYWTDIYIDRSIFQAQEDANLLKSVVLPLEAEIALLKEKLSNVSTQLQKYEPDYQVTDYGLCLV